jgi:hypothetical protein
MASRTDEDSAMRKMLRPAAAAMATLSTVLLLGCSAQNGSPAAGSPNGPFTVDTPLQDIAANPQGKAILDADVPGVMSSPKYPMIEDMSLAQIATFANGKIPKEKLDQVQSDLDALAAQQAAEAKAAAAQAAAQAAAEKQAAAEQKAAAKKAAAEQKAAAQAAAKQAKAAAAAAPAAATAVAQPATDQSAVQ